ncbi:MAG: hypothetical protein ABIS21_06050, partial [Acidimicrobiales bacterium]
HDQGRRIQSYIDISPPRLLEDRTSTDLHADVGAEGEPEQFVGAGRHVDNRLWAASRPIWEPDGRGKRKVLGEEERAGAIGTCGRDDGGRSGGRLQLQLRRGGCGVRYERPRIDAHNRQEKDEYQV